MNNVIPLNPISVKDFEFLLLPGKWPEPEMLPKYESIYQMWKDVWAKTFKELDGQDKVFSDDFIRQDEIAAIFYKGEPVGSSSFNWLDLRITSHAENSYFKPFPKEVIGKIIELGHWNALVGSYFTLAPKWRKENLQMPLKDIIFGLVVKRFMESGASVMVGTMRNDKGMDGVAYRYGAEPMKVNVIHHNVEVDLVLFDRNKVHDNPLPGVQRAVNKLWNQRINTNVSPLKQTA